MPDNQDRGDKGGYPGGSYDRRLSLIYIIIGIALVAYMARGFASGLRQDDSTTTLTTNDFVTAVKEDRVSEVTYKTSDGKLTGGYWTSTELVGKKSSKKSFVSYYVGADSLQELMADHPKVAFTINTEDGGLLEMLLTTVVPTLIMMGVMVYLFSQVQGQNNRAMGFGHTKAQTSEETRPNVKFSDVAGIDEAVEELQEVRDFLAEPERSLRMGAKIPHGVLLVGPPGCGKTLLAKAIAGEAGVPFFSISGSDFVEMFVGVGASRVRDLFKQAKDASPAIIFIDEIDAVGRQRGAGVGGSHDEREQTLNQMLVEMDGFEDNSSVILVAATNRPDILDPALLRPGRFDRQVTVDRPDVKGREKILQVHAANKPLRGDVDFERLAKLTPGFTGADLANLMNEAALLAARRRKSTIGLPEIEEAMERVIAGPEKKGRVMTEAERRTIAYHESGHALVGHLLDNADPVHKISIIARGRALGYTLSLPEEDHFLQTRSSMLDELAVFLAGRTAEELFCDDITTGASNDLERATKMAREMVTRYGMSEALGTQVYGEAQREVFLGRDYANHQDLSAETTKRIDDEVERIMREAHERARAILTEHAGRMHKMAEVLLAQETVEGEMMEALLNGTYDEWAAAHADEVPTGTSASEPTEASDTHDDGDDGRNDTHDTDERGGLGAQRPIPVEEPSLVPMPLPERPATGASAESAD